MSHDKWIEQAELYALGALETVETAEFEAHLKGRCRTCEDVIRRSSEGLALLAASVPQAMPAPGLKAAVMERIEAEPVVRAGVSPLWKWACIGLFALAAAYVAVVRSFYGQARSEVLELNAQIDDYNGRIMRADAATAYLRDADVQLVHLKGEAGGRTLSGTLLWDPVKGKGLFLASGMEPLPKGSAYEFWMIEKGKPLSAGMFLTDSRGNAHFELPQKTGVDFEQFAITVERADAPRHDAPAGPIVLSGAVF
jgi:anti-sigma-K factor RskA